MKSYRNYASHLFFLIPGKPPTLDFDTIFISYLKITLMAMMIFLFIMESNLENLYQSNAESDCLPFFFPPK